MLDLGTSAFNSSVTLHDSVTKRSEYEINKHVHPDQVDGAARAGVQRCFKKKKSSLFIINKTHNPDFTLIHTPVHHRSGQPILNNHVQLDASRHPVRVFFCSSTLPSVSDCVVQTLLLKELHYTGDQTGSKTLRKHL